MFQNILKKNVTSRNCDIIFFKIMFYFLKIFGILPVSYCYVWKRETQSWDIEFKFSWTGTIYNFILIFTKIFFIIFFLYLNIIELKYVTPKKQENLVLTIMLNFNHLFNLLIMILFILRYSKVASIMNEIYKLRRLAAQSYVADKKLLCFYIGNIILCSTVKTIFHITVYGIQNIFTFTDYITHVLFFQYSFLLKILECYCKFINYSLHKSLLKRSDWTSQNFKLNMKIDMLIHLNSRIYDLSQELSNFYSFPMIFATFNFYLYLLINPYFFIKRAFITNDMNL